MTPSPPGCPLALCSPQPHTNAPDSLLQAEYRLYNGSDKECVSPTSKVTKKEALKVGTGPGKGQMNRPVRFPRPSLPKRVGDRPPPAASTPLFLPLVSLSLSSPPPPRAGPRGPGGGGAAARGPCPDLAVAALVQVQKENYRQEKKRATRQLFSALTDPSVVIMADSLKVCCPLGHPRSESRPSAVCCYSGGRSPRSSSRQGRALSGGPRGGSLLPLQLPGLRASLGCGLMTPASASRGPSRVCVQMSSSRGSRHPHVASSSPA